MNTDFGMSLIRKREQDSIEILFREIKKLGKI